MQLLSASHPPTFAHTHTCAHTLKLQQNICSYITQLDRSYAVCHEIKLMVIGQNECVVYLQQKSFVD